MKQPLIMERTYRATIDQVWNLWTTAEGIESWWGPEGFRVKVRTIDLRAGGALLYEMIAVGEQQIAFMQGAGMPLSTLTTIRYREVQAKTRLAYTTNADFIPGVAAYDVTTVVELHQEPTGIRMVLTHDRMHDDTWTQRAAMGWESQLQKLNKVFT
jgi:uncharacterized protein YndB with AHSA1/START domain